MTTTYGDGDRRQLANEDGAAEFITKRVDFGLLKRRRYTPGRASRHTRQTAAKPYGLPPTGDMTRLMACACVGQKGGQPPAGRSSRSADRARSAPLRAWHSAARSPAPRPGRHGSQGRFTRGQKASRQPVGIATVTPSSRQTVSGSSPRNSPTTAARLRRRDILPPPPNATVPDPRARSPSRRPTPTWFA